MQQALEAEHGGDLAEAKVAWEAVLEQSAGYALAYVGLGKIAYQNGEYEAARIILRRATTAAGIPKRSNSTARSSCGSISSRLLPGLPVIAAVMGTLLIRRAVRRRKNRNKN